MPMYRAIGLMSGTSMDGVDVALVETDGEWALYFGPTGFYPYSDDDRALLRGAFAEAATLEDRTARPGVLALRRAHGHGSTCRGRRDVSARKCD